MEAMVELDNALSLVQLVLWTAMRNSKVVRGQKLDAFASHSRGLEVQHPIPLAFTFL